MRHKKKQRLKFTTAFNKVPTWHVSGVKRGRKSDDVAESSTSTKKAKNKGTDQKDYLQYLNNEMNIRLKNKIVNCLENKDDLEKLKNDCLSVTKLERGLVTGAEQRASLPAATIEKFLKRSKKKNTEYWTDFVERNFDNIADEQKKQRKGKGREDVMTSSDDAGFVIDSTGKTATQDKKKPEICEEIRSATTSLNNVLRDDLPVDIRNHFLQTVAETLEKSTDYIANYGIQLFKLLLQFKHKAFVLNQTDDVSFVERKGPSIKEFLPPNYEIDNSKVYLPPPPDEEFLNSKVFDKHMKSLFDSNHLKLIHSTYFGPRGIQESTLKKSPLHQALIKDIPPKQEQREMLDSYIMKQALAKFTVNFTNLWKNFKGLNSLLKRLLLVLLKIHLAPIRVQKIKEYVEKKKSKQAQRTMTSSTDTNTYETILKDNISLIRKTRSNKRQIFKNEIRRRQKYLKKAEEEGVDSNKWTRKAERCDIRINTYKEVLEKERSERKTKSANLEEVDEELELELRSIEEPVLKEYQLELDDETIEENNDTSRRRINILQAVLAKLIYKHEGKIITLKQIQEVLSDISAEELNVCKLILDLIQLYFPTKKNRYNIASQLPFVLMANHVLVITGYSKKASKICPLTLPGHLNALSLDASGLFSLFCGKNCNIKQLDIYDFDGNQITTRQLANEQKDAVFNSFFNFINIMEVSSSHHQIFNHIITFLPGLKTVRMSGVLKKYPPSYCCKEVEKAQEETVSIKNTVSTLSLSDKKDMNDRIRLLNAEINALNAELKEAIKKRKDFIILDSIKDLKKKWIRKGTRESLSAAEKEANGMIYNNINKQKQIRDDLESNVRKITTNLKIIRTDAYSLRKRLENEEYHEYSGKVKQVDEDKKFLITNQNYKCYKKTEDVILDDSIRFSDNITLSGTDNGIVSMTETMKFDMQKFKYHIKLYSQNLQNEDIKFSKDDMKQAALPRTLKTKSTELDYKSGNLKARIRLNRRKKGTEEGRSILRIENNLKNKSLYKVDTSAELDTSYKEYYSNRKEMRKFYYSQSRIKESRNKEVQSRKCYDLLCSDERSFNCDNKSQQIMFIGDRGYGFGSNIKGHMKYGGTWKGKKHSLYTTVCITNENLTSQICVFCFEKTSHPLQTITKNGRKYIKRIRGTTVCTNKNCILNKINCTHKGRDAMSAAAICISGASLLFLKAYHPAFNIHSENHAAAKFNKNAAIFLNRNIARPTIDDGNTF